MEWVTGKHPRLRGRHLRVGPALALAFGPYADTH